MSELTRAEVMGTFLRRTFQIIDDVEKMMDENERDKISNPLITYDVFGHCLLGMLEKHTGSQPAMMLVPLSTSASDYQAEATLYNPLLIKCNITDGLTSEFKKHRQSPDPDISHIPVTESEIEASIRERETMGYRVLNVDSNE